MIGPRAGGTDVTVTGRELDTGNSVRVLFDNVPCHIDRSAAVSIHDRSTVIVACLSVCLSVCCCCCFLAFLLSFSTKKVEYIVVVCTHLETWD